MVLHTEELINFQRPGDWTWRSVFWCASPEFSKKHSVVIFRVELPTQRQSYFPGFLNFQQHRCENLRSHIILVMEGLYVLLDGW